MTEKDYGSRYRVTEKIGAGGMADVYKGVDNVLGRTVAIKVLHARLAADSTFAARFRQEAQAAANLSSPNIVSIYDWGKTGDTYYIVMEFVDGKDLKDIIAAQGALPPTKVADIGAQVAAALVVAHRADVIHRDVKPHNIMVQPDGTVKVMDFGIARAGNTTMTQTGSVLGTAHYVSPEQAQGKPLTPASDVYSLGVALYEAATGRMPFDADTPVAVALKQVNEQPVPPRKVNPAIPIALETVILKAMAKDPAQRYPSADAMRKDLLSVSAGRPVEATVPKMDQTAVMTAVPSAATGRGARTAPPAKKKSRWWIWTLLVLALLATGIAAAWWMGAFKPSIAVPNVRGRTIAQAMTAIEEAKLKVGTTKQQFDANVEAGRVIEQDPAPGTQVEEGAAVNLIISRGVEKAEVPNVVGKTDSEAADILQNAGFVLTLPKREFSSKPEGTVLEQDPKAGTNQPKGSSITLTVSKGQQLIEVPSVTGKGQSDATAILEDAGFDVETQSEFSDTVSKGVVISQNPDAGVPIFKGATVTITVSKGPDLVSVPDVLGDAEATARKKIEDRGLVFEVSTQDSTPANEGKVINVTPTAGTKVKPGSTVKIVVGTVPEPPTPPGP